MAAERREEDVADIKFSGGRFEGEGFPLDGIAELQTYQRIIHETARMLWHQQNPGRRRVPTSLGTQTRMRLTAVEEGSVVPVLEREQSQLQIAEHADDLLAESVEYVNQLFDNIVRGRDLPAGLPDGVTQSLKSFGSTFKPNEQIHFMWSSPRAFSYDARSRKKFLASLASATVRRNGPLIGRVRMLDLDSKFILVDAVGNEIEGSFSKADIFDDFHSVHGREKSSKWIWLDAQYLVQNESNHVVKVEDVDSVGEFAEADSPLAGRLAELATYQDGWLDGDGKRVTLDALIVAKGFADELTKKEIRRPSVFADADGGVRFEWLTDKSHATILVDAQSVFCGSFVDVASGEDDYVDDLQSPANAADFVRRHVHD
jgi:hypothetical protein